MKIRNERGVHCARNTANSSGAAARRHAPRTLHTGLHDPRSAATPYHILIAEGKARPALPCCRGNFRNATASRARPASPPPANQSTRETAALCATALGLFLMYPPCGAPWYTMSVPAAGTSVSEEGGIRLLLWGWWYSLAPSALVCDISALWNACFERALRGLWCARPHTASLSFDRWCSSALPALTAEALSAAVSCSEWCSSLLRSILRYFFAPHTFAPTCCCLAWIARLR
mmetsp:Transcript_29281/g.72288  ORF Transcript_29281/g.72288 Transcript_29281/m.72288 type:complete len:232 (+) Transcript_29281:1182-1877(+)